MRKWRELLIVVAVTCVGAYASYFKWHFKPQTPERAASNIIKADVI